MGFYTKLINEKSVNWYEGSIPHPSTFKTKDYWYICLITVPKEKRGQGYATQKITQFCKGKKKPIYIALHKYPKIDMNGWVLQKLLKRLGFKVLSKNAHVIEMVRA